MRIAIVGNPNSGKTTLFNRLTGSTAHVGNWPGVTVDKKSGYYSVKKRSCKGNVTCGDCAASDNCGSISQRIEIIDLPGIYSLSAYSPEEVVSRDFIAQERPDCIINIVDATNLERNLYLTTQLLEMDVPVVIALNMMDEVRKSGGDVVTAELSRALGVPALKISALKGEGLDELMHEAMMVGFRKGSSLLDKSCYSELYLATLKLYKDARIESPAFAAAKLLEEDSLELERHKEIASAVLPLKKQAGLLKGDEYNGEIADARYKYIEQLCLDCLKKATVAVQRSEKIDRVLTHKWWGIPIFLLIMATVFHFTFSENFLFIGVFIPEGTFDVPILGVDGLNSPGVILLELVVWFAETVKDALSVMPEGTWYTSLVCDGLLEGLFAVLSFVPQIMLLFFFISILEDSGYMARVAFIMDRALRKLGLSGKAFMPMIMCFGCAVPGIMGMRIIEDEGERRRAIYISPFFSCGAKLPIWAAFAGVFAANYSALSGELVVVSMYVLGIVVAIVASLLLKTFLAKAATPPLILEMPSYRVPNARNVLLHLWDKFKHYLFRAATVIAAAIVVIWFLTNFSFTLKMVDSENSIIGVLGKGLAYLFYPLGFALGEDGWKFVVALLTGLVAKEMVVATMGAFAGLGEVGGEIGGTALGALMLGIGGSLGGVSVAIPAMYAFMAFNLLSIPCMAAVSAARAELNNRKYFWLAIVFWLLTAYVVSGVVFWFGVLATVAWWAALIVAVAAVGGIGVVVWLRVKRK